MALVQGGLGQRLMQIINIKESDVLAAYFLLQAFAKSSKSISIHLFLDNRFVA
jgi:hypothetical protein